MNGKEEKREKKTREIILLAFHKSSSCRPSQFAATKGFSPYLWYIFVNSQRNMKEGSLLQFRRGIVFWWIDSMLIYRIHQYGFCQQGTLIIKPMTKKEFFEIENFLVWSLQWTNLSSTHITPGTNVGNQKLLQYPCRKWNREKVFVKTVGDKECSSAFLA